MLRIVPVERWHYGRGRPRAGCPSMPALSVRGGPGSRTSPGTRNSSRLRRRLRRRSSLRERARKHLEPLDGYRDPRSARSRWHGRGAARSRPGHGTRRARGRQAAARTSRRIPRSSRCSWTRRASPAASTSCHRSDVTVGALDGRRAIVMEFLDGHRFSRVVRRAEERGSRFRSTWSRTGS